LTLSEKIIGKIRNQPGYIVLLPAEILLSIIYFPKYLYILLSGKTVIAFDWSDGMYASFYRPIIKELKKINIEAVLFFNFGNTNKFGSIILKSGLPRIYADLLPNKIILCAGSSEFRKMRKTIRVQMFHGFGSFGSLWQRNYIENFEVLFLVTKYQAEQLLKDFKDVGITKKIYKIGYPRLDNFMTYNYYKNQRRAKRAILFYGPTYHREISSVFEFLDPLVNLCEKNAYKLVIKLHPFLYHKHSYDESGLVDWKKEISEYCKKYKSILSIKDDNLIKHFAEADIFLTDVSGIGYEFVLATGKPIIFLGNKLKVPLEDLRSGDLNKYSECSEIYYRGRIGPIVLNPIELEPQIKRLISKNEYKPTIDSFREDFIYNPGCGAVATCEAIKEIMTEADKWKKLDS